MKSKELIALLQKEDPSGEGDVLVITEEGNVDIFTLMWKEGYWDGCKQLLVRDPAKKPYYDIVGAEYRSDGDKLCVCTMGVYEALVNNPDLPVKVVDGFVEKRMQQKVDEWRKEIKEIYKKVQEQKDDNQKL